MVCKKPLYRAPKHLLKVRHVACMEHRAEAQKISGITDKQKAGLSKGRVKGENRRLGTTHRPEVKAKIAEANKRFYEQNPEVSLQRGAMMRGENSPHWKGGVARLNLSVRQLTENRNWTDEVKKRDGECVMCGAKENLEAHHIRPLAEIMKAHGITNREQARDCAALWDVDNGMTVCVPCHYAIHGRTPAK